MGSAWLAQGETLRGFPGFWYPSVTYLGPGTFPLAALSEQEFTLLFLMSVEQLHVPGAPADIYPS